MGKINYWKRLREDINRGLKGYNVGLPNGFDRLNDYVTNIQQRTYYTIGGATGTGKTAFVDSAFLFYPYDYLQNNESIYSLEVIYYSLEIPPEDKLRKFVCFKLKEKYDITIDPKQLRSQGKKKLDPNILPYVDELEEYFTKMQEEVLHFRPSMSPDYMYKDIMSYAESRGKIIRNSDGIIVDYKPDNPFLITEIIIDHSNLIDLNKQDKSKKEAIDRASKMLVFFRNMFGFSPIIVSQFNRGIEGMDRKKQDSQEPQLSDFKETGSTQEDANVVLGLFNPFRYGIDTHRGYPVDKIKRFYRSLHVLKNRDGADNLAIGLHFDGPRGKFKELPTSKDLRENPQLLQKILNYGKNSNGSS
jgi:replicative DNA helicase